MRKITAVPSSIGSLYFQIGDEQANYFIKAGVVKACIRDTFTRNAVIRYTINRLHGDYELSTTEKRILRALLKFTFKIKATVINDV